MLFKKVRLETCLTYTKQKERERRTQKNVCLHKSQHLLHGYPSPNRHRKMAKRCWGARSLARPPGLKIRDTVFTRNLFASIEGTYGTGCLSSCLGPKEMVRIYRITVEELRTEFIGRNEDICNASIEYCYALFFGKRTPHQTRGQAARERRVTSRFMS